MGKKAFYNIAFISFAGCLGYINMTVAPLPKPEADAILVGRVNTCMFVTTYKHNAGDIITQEIAHINVDFKIIDVETGDLAVIANNSLNAHHLLKKPVKMESRKILSTPNYYTKYFASADHMIDIYVEETLCPVVEAKKALSGK
ncbi:MAG: hypothetical protein PHO00_08495 [bacterium]|nr:hypothetical protein [bacterium]